MGAIRRHFEKHGFVHALWLIAVLLFIVAWLMLRTPNGGVLQAYIGFAASIASLVLALVAIGYAYVSNQGFSETVGTLRSSAESLRTTAENIADTSTTLNQRFDEMVGQVERVPAAVDALGRKLEETIQVAGKPQQVTDEQSQEQAEATKIMGSFVYGGQVAMYVLSKSIETSKPFLPSKIFKGSDATIWAGVVVGFMIALSGAKIFGVHLTIDAVGEEFIYTVRSVGNLNAKEYIDLFESTANPQHNDPVMKEINDYFMT